MVKIARLLKVTCVWYDDCSSGSICAIASPHVECPRRQASKQPCCTTVLVDIFGCDALDFLKAESILLLEMYLVRTALEYFQREMVMS